MKKTQITLLVSMLVTITGLWACGNNTESNYENLRRNSRKATGKTIPGADKLIGKFGAVELHLGELNYSLSHNTNISPEEIKNLSVSSRNLIIKKQLLRRYIVQQGLNSGTFDSEQAAKYILPRLERILEDYYVSQQANFKKIDGDLQKFEKIPAALRNKGKEHGIKPGTLERERDKILTKLNTKRKKDARAKVIQKILADNPQMEFGL